MTIQLDHMNVRCTDVEAVRRFYQDVLQLKAGPRPAFSSEGYWLYADGAPLVHLVQRPKGEAPADPHAALDHIAFRCTGKEEIRGRLEALRIPYRETAIPGTPIVQFFLHDPEGAGIELNFPPS